MLEDGLAGNRDRIVEQLKTAAAWARRLGLTATLEEYHGWGEARPRLALFRDAEVDRLARTAYALADDTPQLDLFFDSGTTAALNDLCDALAARDPEAADRHLATLAEADPNHAKLPFAEALTDALGHLNAPLREPAEELAAVQALAARADELLAGRARDFIAPFWRRLTKALPAERFDPAEDRLHPSWTAARYLDWPTVATAVRAVPDHEAHAVLLARLAEALLAAGEEHAGLAATCRLCWRHPGAAEVWLEACTDAVLADARETFWDRDEPLSPEWFPAWLLITAPGLAHHLDATLGADCGRPGEAFATLHRLAAAPDDEDQRTRLKALSPNLFQAWLPTANRRR